MATTQCFRLAKNDSGNHILTDPEAGRQRPFPGDLVSAEGPGPSLWMVPLPLSPRGFASVCVCGEKRRVLWFPSCSNVDATASGSHLIYPWFLPGRLCHHACHGSVGKSLRSSMTPFIKHLSPLASGTATPMPSSHFLTLPP